MARRNVIRMGHPLLRELAQPLTKEEILSSQDLIQDLFDTMAEEKGIGIAAPQIGISLQVAIIELPKENPRYPDVEESDTFVIFNPKITVLDATTQGYWEGCLSVPGLRGYVERPRKIYIEYLDQEANSQKIELEGFLATVFQHELDHLFGILYIDRVTDKTKLSFIEEFVQFHSENEQLEEDV